MSLKKITAQLSEEFDKFIILNKEIKIDNPYETKQKFMKYVNDGLFDEALSIVKEVSEKINKPIPANIKNILELSKNLDLKPIEKTEKEYDDVYPYWLFSVISDYARNTPESKIYKKLDVDISYDTAVNLMKDILFETNKLVFIEPLNINVEGRIITAYDSKLKKVTLAAKLSTINKDGDELSYAVGIDELAQKQKYTPVDEISKEFYLYVFETKNKRFLLMSETELNVGKCVVSGYHIPIKDRKKIGEDIKMAINSEIIIVRDVKPYFCSYTLEDVKSLTASWNHEYIAERTFSPYRHPKWFEKLVFAMLFSYREYGYPLHLFMIAKEGTGKSVLLNSLIKAIGEHSTVISAGGTTVKGLVPSFNTVPPSEGELMKFERVCCIDEFLDMLTSMNKNTGGMGYTQIRYLNDIVEHKKTTMAGNGHSITVQMSSRMFAVSNPTHGVNDAVSFFTKLDRAFVSRFLVYFQNEAHIEFIHENRVFKREEKSEFKEIIELIDFFAEQYPVIDEKRANEILYKYIDLVPSDIISAYKHRYSHHLLTLISGIAKYNFVVEQRDELIVTDKDYEEAEEIFSIIISSWNDTINITDIPLKAREHYLVGIYREIFQYINKYYKVTKAELQEKFNGEKFNYNLDKLIDIQLIKTIEIDGVEYYCPYWYGNKKQHTLKQDNKEQDENENEYTATTTISSTTLIDEIKAAFKDAEEVDYITLKNIIGEYKITKAFSEGLIYEPKPGKIRLL